MLYRCCMVGTVESINTGAQTMTNEQVNVDAIKPNDAAQAMYLEWVNNFLTITRFAEHYQLTEDAAEQLIAWGSLVHEQRTES